MKKVVWALSVALLIAGCKQDDQTSLQTRLYENGTPKPIVAIVPLIDNTRHGLSWNVSDEITALIHYRLMQKETLYLVDEEKVGTMLKRIKETHHLFDTDLAWIKKIFHQNEFVVFMELINHKEIPIPSKEVVSPEELPVELSIQVRLRVIDLRGEEAVVVLQEIVQDAHFIPKQFTKTHFTQVEWGKDNYAISPLGIAHANVSKEIATRLEDYILLSMKRS